MIRSGDDASIQQFMVALIMGMRQLIKNVLELVYYMKGGLTYTEAMNMSAVEREIAMEFVSDKLQEEAKAAKAGAIPLR